MENTEVIKITDENGEVVNAHAITILRNPANEKRYLLYTFDIEAKDIDIYAAILTNNSEVYTLSKITSEEDWNIVQAAISNLTGEQL